jgi:hypothetical protein
MDIFNKLLVSYQVESTQKKGDFRTFNLLIEGEIILIENSNFLLLPLNQQLLIVKKFVDKDRRRYKTKEYVNIRWEETTPEKTHYNKTYKQYGLQA